MPIIFPKKPEDIRWTLRLQVITCLWMKRLYFKANWFPDLECGAMWLCAVPGQDQPGYMVLGPNRFFPSGKYRARFRIKAGLTERQQEVGRIEIIEDRTKIVVKKILRGR